MLKNIAIVFPFACSTMPRLFVKWANLPSFGWRPLKLVNSDNLPETATGALASCSRHFPVLSPNLTSSKIVYFNPHIDVSFFIHLKILNDRCITAETNKGAT